MLSSEQEQEINQRVYERYPLTDLECTCKTEKERKTQLREIYKERLIREIEQETI